MAQKRALFITLQDPEAKLTSNGKSHTLLLMLIAQFVLVMALTKKKEMKEDSLFCIQGMVQQIQRAPLLVVEKLATKERSSVCQKASLAIRALCSSNGPRLVVKSINAQTS